MKKILLLFVAIAAIAFSGCSKDDDSFKYEMSVIYGKWEGTGIKVDGKWIDITNYIYWKYQFSATFRNDGTYSGTGFFGNGSGTYKAKGDTIITYVDGTEYARYKIASISGDIAEMTMIIDGENIDIRCKKE